MEQYQESLADVARRSFAVDQLEVVFELLDKYKGSEPERVRRALLALSSGDLGKLAHDVDVALRDYRDVLYWAEYPPTA